MGKIHPQENWATEYLKLVPTLFGRTKFTVTSPSIQDSPNGTISLTGQRLYEEAPVLLPRKLHRPFLGAMPNGSNQESSNDRQTAMHETCKS